MWIRGIDGKDNEIINLLLKDGRMSYSEIGEKIGITRTAVKNRIEALENAGIIEGYKVVVNPQKSPQMMTFVMNVETAAEHFESAKKELAETEYTLTVVQTTGNCHLMAICVAPDIATMRNFVNAVYRQVKGILSINAHAVLDVIKGNIIPD